MRTGASRPGGRFPALGVAPSAGWRSAGAAALVFFASFHLVALIDGGVWALDAPPSGGQAVSFNIPRQPLAQAIQAYSQTSGVDVFYESRIAAGGISNSVTGDYPPDAALRLLLGGADFSIRFTKPNAVVLSLPTARDDLPPDRVLQGFDFSLDTIRVAADPPPARANEARLQEFGEAVTTDMEAALRKNLKIRSGNYRVQLKLWIDPSSVVRRVEMAQTTGDPERDAAITGLLQGFVVSRVPPPATPQPIRIIVAVRSL
jgi:hypothetical protein